MKLLILSDSHGHITNLKTAIEIGLKAGIKAIIHCGDWDNVESIEMLLNHEVPLYSVMGNADVDSDIEDLLRGECAKFDSLFLKFNLDGRRIGLTHRVKNEFIETVSNMDIVFSGHYHSKEEKMFNFVKFVRPGALLNGINFAIYETETNEVQFINETD